jgi:hypothetical protein
MRTFKLIGALVLVLAFSAIGVASASAAETLWPWLPGSAKETFTGKSGVATLQMDGGAAITCAKSVTLLAGSELTENAAKLWLATIHFEGCKESIFGQPVNSLGDASGVILVHIVLHNCMIAKGDFGVLVKPLLTHLEIPNLGQLIVVQGSFVGRIKALVGDKKHFELEITQKGGLQTIEKCEGGVKESLESSTNEGSLVEAGEQANEGLLLFDGTIDKNGEELMEK